MANQKQKAESLGFVLLLFLVLLGFKMTGSVITENWVWWIVVASLFVYLVYKFAALNKVSHNSDFLNESGHQ